MKRPLRHKKCYKSTKNLRLRLTYVHKRNSDLETGPDLKSLGPQPSAPHGVYGPPSYTSMTAFSLGSSCHALQYLRNGLSTSSDWLESPAQPFCG